MVATFTFKKGPTPTGLSAVAHPYSDTDIKLRGKIVGMIGSPSHMAGRPHWDVRLMVKKHATPDSPCDWKWVFLKGKHETEADARQWVKEKTAAILEQFDLAEMEP